MKKYVVYFVLTYCFALNAQVDLSNFEMSNSTSPAFLLVEEAPTEIYTPENVRALAIHALDNFGNSLSIEVAPYFFFNPNATGRTYYNYIGVEQNEENEVKQNPFSGLNTTSISFAYVEKEFAGFDSDKKTFSIGARTTLLRFFNKKKVIDNANAIANLLMEINPPIDILSQGEEAIQDYYINEQKVNSKFAPYQKMIKPLFKVDAAMAYSALFKENKVSSGTANRFGSWLTAEGSFIINEGSNSKHNNYINLLLTARYIEDGFNINTTGDYFKNNYRDFGGKIAADFGKFTFAYEYIKRNGTINSERSVGTINFMINKDVSLVGGFGKDFDTNEDLVTIFGINWGFNLGNKTVK